VSTYPNIALMADAVYNGTQALDVVVTVARQKFRAVKADDGDVYIFPAKGGAGYPVNEIRDGGTEPRRRECIFQTAAMRDRLASK